MTATNALWMLLSIVPMQTPAPSATLAGPQEQAPLVTEPIPGPTKAMPVSEAVPEAQAALAPLPMEDLARRLYGGGEYLQWWLREARVPPLLTTSSAADAGVIGA